MEIDVLLQEQLQTNGLMSILFKTYTKYLNVGFLNCIIRLRFIFFYIYKLLIIMLSEFQKNV